jgi:hypothetical protein
LGTFPLSLHRAVMAAAINGKCRRPEPARLPLPSSLRFYLNPCSIACASLCLPNTPIPRTRAQFHLRRRLGSPPPPCKRRRR